MNTRRLRPKWTLGTMLLVVGWSSVVVWLNVRERIAEHVFYREGERCSIDYVACGYPLTYSYSVTLLEPDHPYASRIGTAIFHNEWALPLNIAIGLIAVVILTWTSRAILSALRAILSKPSPADVDGD